MVKSSKSIVAVAILTMGLSACVKQRPDQYADGTVDKPMLMSDVTGAQMTIHTASQPQALSTADSLRVENQGTLVAVDNYSGPDQFRAMFSDLVIRGKPNMTYSVRFALDHQYLTAYKLVSDASELSPFESQLAAQFATQFDSETKASGKSKLRVASAEVSAANEVRVPLFQYAVKDYGNVNHAQNELNEQTNILRLDHSDWSSAPYVLISTREADRLAPTVGAGDPSLGRVFARSELDQKVLTKQELQNELQVSTSDQDTSTPYYVKVDGSHMNLYRVMATPSPDLIPEQLSAISSGDAGAMKRAGILACSDAAKAALHGNSSSCLMVHAFQVDASPVSVSRVQVDDGLSNTISYNETADASAPMVMIKLHPTVTKLLKIDKGDLLDPTKTLVVDRMKDKEFLMTRTLTDSPSVFGDLFLGNAGKLEIVRFEFLPDRVRVVRSKPRVQHQGSNDGDLDTLMSYPATYSVLTNIDDDGSQLAAPKKKDANYNTPGAIAVIDWTKNDMPELNSPLDFFDVDTCFSSENEKEISDVDYQADQGLLGLTYTRTYEGNRWDGSKSNWDCGRIYANFDYFARYPQTNFRFSERISFREYDKSHDSNVILDMPFEVQQQLGFGTFTYPIVNADKYGDTDRKASQQNLAMLWDLKNGKKISYVLAGLPEKGAPGVVSRQDIIDATRSVFKDLNVAMHKALKGSPLERPDTEDILELKIEGDDVPVGHLGDIQRNTIYWVQKQLDSPIWGLAQAQPNPRSGMIETSNVYVYGGNFLSSVPSMKDRAMYEKKYADLLASVASAEQPNSADKLKDAEKGLASSKATTTAQKSKAQKRLEDLVSMTSRTVDPSALMSTIETHPNLAKIPSRVADKTQLAGLRDLQPYFMNQANAKAVALQKVLEQARTQGLAADPKAFEALVDANLQDILGGKLSNASASKLKAMAAHAQMHAQAMKRLENAGVCVYDRSEVSSVSPANSGVDVLKWSDKEWVMNIYKPTLAHEVGHTLGLRHNFQGSYDKANWYFSDSDQKKRTYSSIMDYMVDDHITYDGMGPYDVAALRAAYTGRVELGDGSLVSLDDVKKAAGVSDWFEFKAVKPESLTINGKNLKKYDFCTDDDLGGDPTCRQFDHGTTPLEIVNYDINEYKALYPLINFPNDRQSFSELGTGRYIGRLFMTMINIRKFLEETFHQSIHGANRETLNSYLNAAMRGMWFFQEIIRTPDAPSWASGDRRFRTVSDSKGNRGIIERKSLQDIGVPNDNSDELLVRGVELDKIIAMLMLTERSFGIPRYARDSILMSYPELERMLNGGDPMKSITVDLLTEILGGNITPITWVNERPLAVSKGFAAATTDMMRFYATIQAMVALNADSISQDNDPSSLFRVLGTSNVPKGIEGAMMLGSGGPEGELMYWAPGGAPASDSLIRQAVAMQVTMSQADKLKPLLLQWTALKLGVKLENRAEDGSLVKDSASSDASKAVTDGAAAQHTRATGAEMDADGYSSMKSSQPGSMTAAQAAATASQLSSGSSSQTAQTAAPDEKTKAPDSVGGGKPAPSLDDQINQILASLPPEAGNTIDDQGNVHPLTTKELEEELQVLTSRHELLTKLLKLAGDAAGGNSDADRTAFEKARQLFEEAQEALRNQTTADARNSAVMALFISIFNRAPGQNLPLPDTFMRILPADSSFLEDTQGMIVDNAKNLDEILVALHPEVLREYK